MKKIDTTQETATAWSPWKVESKAFIQTAYSEAFESLIKSVIYTNLGAYDPTKAYIVEGCVLSNSNRDISTGVIFYNGVFYNVGQITSGTAPLEFQLESSADGTADPTTFSDGSPHSIHLDYHFTTYSAGAAPTPSFTVADLVNLYGAKIMNLTSLASQSFTSTSYVDASGLTYTTPNDGITRRYLINFKSQITPSNAAADAELIISLYNGSTDLDIIQVGKQISAITGTVTTAGVLLYSGSIAPNTVLKIRAKKVGGDCTMVDAKLSIIEL
jgi:hypothetical protein